MERKISRTDRTFETSRKAEEKTENETFDNNTKLSVNQLLSKAGSSLSTLSISEGRLKTHASCATSVKEVIRRGSIGELSASSQGNYSNTSGASTKSFSSFGGMSNRSYIFDAILPNGNTVKSERTVREMIFDIEMCAKKNLPRPFYVPKFEELDPDALSWDGQAPTFQPIRSHPNINILSCNHPVELVLALADERTRKMKEITAMKEKVAEQYKQQIDTLIRAKQSRAQVHADRLTHQQRQILWMKILIVGCCCARLRPLFSIKNVLSSTRHTITPNNPTQVIGQAFLRWYRRRIFNRYQRVFTKVLRKYHLRISIGIRIHTKRQAVMRITALLQACHGYQKLQMKTVVRNFLKSVKLVQKVVRAFVTCKSARVDALCRIWDRLEPPFIKRKLKERVDLREMAVTTKQLELNTIHIDEKSRIEMKIQSKRWGMINSKMECSLLKQRNLGYLKQESTAEVLAKLMLSEEKKRAILATVVESKRKEYNIKRGYVRDQLLAQISVFSPADALNLLHGNATAIDKLADRKSDLATRDCVEPFVLYRLTNQRMIYSLIKKAHEEAGTFVIHLDADENNKFAKRFTLLRNAQSALQLQKDGDMRRKLSASGEEDEESECGVSVSVSGVSNGGVRRRRKLTGEYLDEGKEEEEED